MSRGPQSPALLANGQRSHARSLWVETIDAWRCERVTKAIKFAAKKSHTSRRPRRLSPFYPTSRPDQRRITRCRASSPSVSAAGPGCRMIGDLISCNSPSRTAGTPSSRLGTPPDRAGSACRTRSEDDVRGTAHHLPRVRQDAILAERAACALGEYVIAPAIAISSLTQ